MSETIIALHRPNAQGELHRKIKELSRGRKVIKMIMKQHKIIGLEEHKDRDYKYLIRYRYYGSEFTWTFN